MSLATTTSGIANIVQSIPIRNAVAMFHNTIKNNAVAMFHSTTVKHAAALALSTTILASATMSPSITVSVAAAMFQSITISILANQHAHKIVAYKLLVINCVSYCQTGRDFLPV